MAIRRDFAHILREKMDFPLEEESQQAQNPQEKSYFVDYSVNFYTNPYSWTPKKTSPFYKKKPLKKTSFQPLKEQKIPIQEVTPAEKSFHFDKLDHLEKKSFKVLKSLGANLNEEAFTLQQLKREYRHLAKVYHPDRSNDKDSHTIFQSLHDAHRNVCKKITKLSNEEI